MKTGTIYPFLAYPTFVLPSTLTGGLVLCISAVFLFQHEARQIMWRADFMDGTRRILPRCCRVSILSMSRRTQPKEHHRHRRESTGPLR